MTDAKRLITPYYHTLPGDRFGCTTCPKRDQPEYNYSRYDLYCVRTKLKPTLKQEFPGIDGIDIGFKSEQLNNRMVMTLILRNGSKNISLNNLPDTTIVNIQTAIDEATSYFPKECLIFQASTITELPTDWIVTMLSIVDLPTDIKVRMITLDNDAYVYGEFDPESDYVYFSDATQLYILDQLQNMWKQGYIKGAKSIAERWNLKSITESDDLSELEIYKPDWYDVRFAPIPVLFLRERIVEPHGYIKLSLSSNRVLRHVVAEKLSPLQRDLYFNDSYVYITAYSITDAKEIATNVDMALNDAKSLSVSALTYNLSSTTQVKTYLNILNKFFDLNSEDEENNNGEFVLPKRESDIPKPKSVPIVYRGNNPNIPYYVSLLLPLSADIHKILLSIEMYRIKNNIVFE